VSLIVSGAAFLVSAASLYYATLRRPTLDADLTFPEAVAPDDYFASGLPYRPAWIGHLYIVNTGAAGTFLQSIGGSRIDDMPLWEAFRLRVEGFETPKVFEKGDAFSAISLATQNTPRTCRTPRTPNDPRSSRAVSAPFAASSSRSNLHTAGRTP
jgi:hypothetical protein